MTDEEGDAQGPEGDDSAAADLDLVPVFQSSNEAHILLAKSLLDSAEIEYAIRGQYLQDMFSWGRSPGGINLVMGPVVFSVRPEVAGDARALLADLKEPETEEIEDEGPAEP